MTQIERAVMTPILFFDLFDRPIRISALTQLVYGQTVTDEQLVSTLDSLETRQKVIRRQGFVGLAGRRGLTENALARDRMSDELWVEAKNYIGHLASVPFVRMIAVVNSLAFHNANHNSDIDLLVVTESGKIAIARDHLTALITLWGRRNTHGPKRGKLALDVFVDTEHLDLTSFRSGEADIYIDYWSAWLAPVIDRDGTYQKLLAANPWISETFPGFQGHTAHLIQPPARREVRRRLWEAWYRSGVGARIVAWLAAWQRQRLLAYKERTGNDGTVVVTPHLLRFHVPDRRAELQHKFEAQWSHLSSLS